jgi:hypothetical protein
METQTFDDIKHRFPDEWVLLGNPVSEQGQVQTGMLILHSKDKRDVYYSGKDKIADFARVTVVYTGDIQNQRRIGIMRRL